MEEIIEERILENLNDEEKDMIVNNMKLAEKIYFTGMLDSINVIKNYKMI